MSNKAESMLFDNLAKKKKKEDVIEQLMVPASKQKCWKYRLLNIIYSSESVLKFIGTYSGPFGATEPWLRSAGPRVQQSRSAITPEIHVCGQ